MSSQTDALTLVADIGGTNCRLALAKGGTLLTQTITRYPGDHFPTFGAVLKTYLTTQNNAAPDRICLAIAGPVRGASARLTNRDWSFQTDRIREISGASDVLLINDLTALGYASASLGTDQSRILRPAEEQARGNGQSLVIGCGTGVNVCGVHRARDGRLTCLEAEEGHTALPAPLRARLDQAIPGGASHLTSVEDMFSGRGLTALHFALTKTQLSPKQIAAETKNLTTMKLFAEMFGMYCRELALRFMPLNGMWLAGSVSRSLAEHMPEIEAGMRHEDTLAEIAAAIPIALITDDMAALNGCLTALSQQPPH